MISVSTSQKSTSKNLDAIVDVEKLKIAVIITSLNTLSSMTWQRLRLSSTISADQLTVLNDFTWLLLLDDNAICGVKNVGSCLEVLMSTRGLCFIYLVSSLML